MTRLSILHFEVISVTDGRMCFVSFQELANAEFIPMPHHHGNSYSANTSGESSQQVPAMQLLFMLPVLSYMLQTIVV